MHTTNLRKVGGSVMMAVPPAIIEMLNLGAGARVGLTVDNGRLVVEPQPRPRYTLGDLLAQCEAAGDESDEERHWLDDKPMGGELL